MHSEKIYLEDHFPSLPPQKEKQGSHYPVQLHIYPVSHHGMSLCDETVDRPVLPMVQNIVRNG